MTHDTDILIVEDSPTQAEALRHLLAAEGYRVRVARDGNAAFAAVQDQPPALVVTDVVMPGIDGYALCAKIKADEDLREVPVILLTSLAEPQDVIRSLECGADNFIRKPYDERYLLSRISNMLTSRELRLSGKLQVGLEVYLSGEKHFISADRQQILDFLLSTYEEVAQVNEELAARNADLQARQAELEEALKALDEERRRAAELVNVKRAVLDATADGIALVDVDGKLFLTNEAFKRMTAGFPGLRVDRPIAEGVEAIAPLLTDPEGFCTFMESVEVDRERSGHHDLEVSGLRRCFRLFTAPVLDDSGLLIGRIFVFRDTTAERDAERMKSELIATVAHELRTPLASVLGFAELLGRRDLDEPTQKRYLETIHAEARRLTALITDFLDLQKIDEGGLAIRPETLDVNEIVTQQVELFSASSPSHAVSLETSNGPLHVMAERDRLAQVVANLLSNAIKYSPEGGPVEVSSRERAGFVEVAVRDHGLGMPLQQQEKVFTRFFRVDSSDTRQIGGAGLGLALSREIVDAHGGQIGFESVEGEGSTFWFRLPAAEEHDGRDDLLLIT